jgi:hypothetical protein
MHLQTQAMVAGGAAFATTGGATLLSVLQFNPPTLLHLAVGGLVVAVSTVAAAGGTTMVIAERTERQVAGAINDLMEGAIKAISSRPYVTAGVVYLPDKGQILRPQYSYNKPDPLDRMLTFDKWQGAVGQAWGSGQQTVAVLSELTEKQLRDVWKLLPNQISRTQHLKVVIATPIWDSTVSHTPCGVISIDCMELAEDCRLTTDHSLAMMRQLAASIGVVLRNKLEPKG